MITKLNATVISTVLLILVFLVLATTGLVKLMVVKEFIDFMSLPMGIISQIHDMAGFTLVILALIHLTLNFSLLKSMVKNAMK
jgi:hypothetical protein